MDSGDLFRDRNVPTLECNQRGHGSNHAKARNPILNMPPREIYLGGSSYLVFSQSIYPSFPQDQSSSQISERILLFYNVLNLATFKTIDILRQDQDINSHEVY